jgi:hypothetical protein
MSIDGSFTLRPYSAFGSYDKQEQCSFVPIAQGGIFPGTNLQNRPKRTGAIRFELAGPTTHNTHTSTMQLDYTTLYFRSEIDRGEQKREISRLEEEKRQLRVQVISLQAELLQEREGSACAACTICTYTAYDETRTHTEEATMHMFDQDTVVTAEPKPIKLFHETEIEIEIETETEIETEEPITDAKELSEDMLVDASTEADTDAIDNHDDDQDPSEPPVDQCEEEQDVLLSNVSLESSSPPVASDDLLKGIMQDLLDENNIETTNDSKRKRNSETKSRPSSSPCDDETAETPSVTTRRSTRRSRKMAPINSPPPAAINEALQRSVRSANTVSKSPLDRNESCDGLSPVAVYSEEPPVQSTQEAHIQGAGGTSGAKSPTIDEATTAGTPTGSVTTRRSTRSRTISTPTDSPPAINEALQRSVRSNRRNQTTPLELNVSCEDLSPIHIEEPAAPEEQLVAVHSEEAPVHEEPKAHSQASSGTSRAKSPTIDKATTAGTPTGSITTRRSTRSRTISTPTDSPPAINEALQRSVRSNRRNQTTPLELNASCEDLSPIHIEEPSAPEEQLVAVHSEEAPVHEEPKAHSQASGETNRAKSPTIDKATIAGTPTGSITTRRSPRSRTISTPTDSPPAINEALQRSVRSNRRNQTTPLELNASCEGLSPIAVEEPAAPEEQLVAVHSEEAPVHEKSKAHIQASSGTSLEKSPTIDEAATAGTPTGSITTRRSTRSRTISTPTDSPPAINEALQRSVRSNRRNQTTPLELNASCEGLSPIAVEEPAAPEEQLVAVHSEEAPVHEKSKAHIQASGGTSRAKSPTIDEATIAGTPTGSVTTRRSTRSRKIVETDSPAAAAAINDEAVRRRNIAAAPLDETQPRPKRQRKGLLATSFKAPALKKKKGKK